MAEDLQQSAALSEASESGLVAEEDGVVEETALPQEAPPLPQDQMPVSTMGGLAHLPVEVEFNLGQLVLPASALRGLTAGSVLQDLPGLLFPKVELRSAGRVFAEGELVQIGERVGFRITRLVE